jgi:hypothetical protein
VADGKDVQETKAELSIEILLGRQLERIEIQIWCEFIVQLLMMVVKTGEKERVILKYDPYGKMTPNEPY